MANRTSKSQSQMKIQRELNRCLVQLRALGLDRSVKYTLIRNATLADAFDVVVISPESPKYGVRGFSKTAIRQITIRNAERKFVNYVSKFEMGGI